MTAFGAHMRRLMDERGMSLHKLAKIVNYDVGYLCKVRNGHKPASLEVAARVDKALGADGALAALAPPTAAKPPLPGDPQLSAMAQPAAVVALPDSAPDNGHTAPHGDDEEADPTRRRDALRLGFAASIAPGALERVLREAAADAMDFTQQSGSPGVGAGTLDHIEAAAVELSRAYTARPPAELFAVAHGYRTRVQELIQGRHTLAEARELYVYAAWLDCLLAWVAHDLGSLLTAKAFAIDCFEYAAQAGHDEFCAWAATSMIETALDQNRPDLALNAAARGIEICPVSHPLAVRLRAHAAWARARMGQRAGCDDLLAEAQAVWDRLPDTTLPTLNPGTLADYALCAYPVKVYLPLRNFPAARRAAEEAVTAHDARHQHAAGLPSTGAMTRLDLSIALAGLGQPDEAISHGQRALGSPRVVYGVQSRARELDAVLMRRYPKLPEARRFHEQCRELTVAARAEIR
jgi:tetratricopeptide (TPR) repeat protein